MAIFQPGRSGSIILTAIICLALVGCSGGSKVKMAPGYEKTPTRVEAQSNLMGTPEATAVPPTPTPEPLVLDNTPYTLPSQALSFSVPVGWKMSAEADNYVRFEASNQTAWLEAALESSGYELDQVGFEIYMTAMMDALYDGADSYQLLDTQFEEGQAVYTSSLQKGGFTWFAQDVFVQRGAAIYAFSYHALSKVWDAYQPGFSAVTESMETRTGYVDADLVYTFMRTYQSPNAQFSLAIPMGWTFLQAQEGPQGAVLDQVRSPDEQAAVEVLVYDAADELESKDIGQISVPLMKAQDGEDMRIRANEVLLDGRIRVDWQIDKEAVYGFTFFWQDDTVVYILTFKYSDEKTGTYGDTLRRVGDSFAFIAAGS